MLSGIRSDIMMRDRPYVNGAPVLVVEVAAEVVVFVAVQSYVPCVRYKASAIVSTRLRCIFTSLTMYVRLDFLGER